MLKTVTKVEKLKKKIIAHCTSYSLSSMSLEVFIHITLLMELFSPTFILDNFLNNSSI